MVGDTIATNLCLSRSKVLKKQSFSTHASLLYRVYYPISLNATRAGDRWIVVGLEGLSKRRFQDEHPTEKRLHHRPLVDPRYC